MTRVTSAALRCCCDCPSAFTDHLPHTLASFSFLSQLFECLAASTAAMVQQNEDAEAELRELSRGE
jgi:hypothetical protein